MITPVLRNIFCGCGGPACRQAGLVEMYYVYALRSQTRSYIYVGMTNNVDRRVRQHNSGYERTTKPYRPFDLLYTEECATRLIARSREVYLKSGVGKEFLKSLI